MAVISFVFVSELIRQTWHRIHMCCGRNRKSIPVRVKLNNCFQYFSNLESKVCVLIRFYFYLVCTLICFCCHLLRKWIFYCRNLGAAIEWISISIFLGLCVTTCEIFPSNGCSGDVSAWNFGLFRGYGALRDLTSDHVRSCITRFTNGL